MITIKPICGFVVNKTHADEVVAPAYDGFSAEERRHFAENNPNNYINAVRYIDEFRDEENVSYKSLLKQNKKSLHKLIDGEFYNSIDDAVFIYQMEDSNGHLQTGIVCDLPFQNYEDGVIRIHEHTRKDKEKGLSKYIKKVGAISSPVCITYAKHSSIESIVETTIKNPPEIVIESDIIQRLWMIDDFKVIDELMFYFQQIETCYLADGHHRLASGHRYAKKCRKKNAEHRGDEPYNYMLAVLFPDEEMQVLAYNRCIKGLNGLSEADFLAALTNSFTVTYWEDKFHAQPMHRHEFGMLLKDKWYKLETRPDLIPDDPVGILAVSILQEQVLSDILGIKDPKKDARLEYISGETDVEGMEKAVFKDGFDVAFSCFPTCIQEMMDVADIGEVMPPKSTWFSPKVRSGLIAVFRKHKNKYY